MVDDNTMVCTLTVGQLREALGLAEPDPEPAKKEKLTVPEAVEYLNEIGIPITKSTLYRYTMDSTIPFKRFGERKIIFNTTELDSWAQDQLK